MAPFRHIAIILALTAPAMAQGIKFNTGMPSFISFDEERAAGRLNNERESKMMLCFSQQPCREIGVIGKDNLIRWDASVTMDELKAIIQSQQDMTRWRYRNGTPG